MAGAYSITYGDYSKEQSTVKFTGATLTAANLDAQTLLMGDLLSACAGVTLGVARTTTKTADRELITTGWPADSGAQRELKWHIPLRDTVTGATTYQEIPTADPSLCVAGTDFMDETSPEYAALVAAVEAYRLSNAGNPVAVDGNIRLVGRST
jgi:hypothetical protein